MSEKIIQKGKKFINMDTQIQITGNHEVLVEGCKKILEYNDVFIKVKTWDMIIQVWGSGLKVSTYNTAFTNTVYKFINIFNSNGIYIFGNIQSVELIKNG